MKEFLKRQKPKAAPFPGEVRKGASRRQAVPNRPGGNRKHNPPKSILKPPRGRAGTKH